MGGPSVSSSNQTARENASDFLQELDFELDPQLLELIVQEAEEVFQEAVQAGKVNPVPTIPNASESDR